MSTPNPLVPQGTFPDKGKSHVRIAVFTILAIHVVLLGALLIAGCKKTAEPPPADATTNIFTPPPPEPPPLTPPPTNVYVPPVTPPPVFPLPPAAPPEPPAGLTEHTIVKGDSFYTLAKKYNVGWKAIGDANPGVDSSKLKIGQKIKIPAPKSSGTAPTAIGSGAVPAESAEKTYVVKSGDNLMKIAKTHGISLKALRSANKLKTDQIKVGQKLAIPAKAAPAALDPAAPPPVPAPYTPPVLAPPPPGGTNP